MGSVFAKKERGTAAEGEWPLLVRGSKKNGKNEVCGLLRRGKKTSA